jgi:hypothetical protein
MPPPINTDHVKIVMRGFLLIGTVLTAISVMLLFEYMFGGDVCSGGSKCSSFPEALLPMLLGGVGIATGAILVLRSIARNAD